MTTQFDGRWSPGIGDPTVIGWVTVAAYGVAMVLCYLCCRTAPSGPHRRFWLYMTVVMALLGLNKQLDLQTWFTQTGRDIALAQGWYQHRRLVQAIFIAWLVLVGLAAQFWLVDLLRHLDKYARRAVTGLVLLTVFVIVRATSFHHVDKMLGFTIENLSINALLELSGIGLIALAAGLRWRATRRSADPDGVRRAA
ncbi:MAG: hypothetical protein RIS34_2181 [Pseudomonadota bacterium]